MGSTGAADGEVPTWSQLRARVNAAGYETAVGVLRWSSDDPADFYGLQPPQGHCSFVCAPGERWRVEDDQGVLHIQNGRRAYARGSDGGLIRTYGVSPTVPDGHPWSLFGDPLNRGDRFTTESDFYHPAGPARPVVVAGRRAWEVALAPPPHKPHPLILAVDDLTGTVLRETGGDGAWVAELTEFRPHVEVDPADFEWTGPFVDWQPPPVPSGRERIAGMFPPEVELTGEDLNRLRERASIIEALVAALDRRPEVVDTLAAARDENEARDALAQLLGCSTYGAQSVLDMQLRRLVQTPQAYLREELSELRRLLAEHGSGTAGR